MAPPQTPTPSFFGYLAITGLAKIIHRGWRASTERRLLDQVRDRLRLKNFAYGTEKGRGDRGRLLNFDLGLLIGGDRGPGYQGGFTDEGQHAVGGVR
jgi:hypothetical protein